MSQTNTLSLVIEEIDLDEEVVAMSAEPVPGTPYRRPITPDNSVGWFFKSALPDEGENIVLYGHDYSVFANLDIVEEEMLMILHYKGVVYEYTITDIRIFPYDNLPLDVKLEVSEKVLGNTGREVLTLITCHGPTSNERLVVRGERIYDYEATN
jgi:LPXTG-site transpeptidase (sortase) family protein